MKKKITQALLLGLVLLSACSKNEGDNSDASARDLKSYVLKFAAGNTATHYFAKNKETHEVAGNTKTKEYEYNGDGLLTKYVHHVGSKSKVMEFIYTNGAITSIKETDVYSAWPSKTYTRVIQRQGNTIRYEIPHNVFSSDKFVISYTLNNKGLVQAFEQRRKSSNRLEAKFNFSYDANENCIKVTTERYVAGTQVKATLNNAYDNKENPLHEHFKSNYNAHLFITDEASFFGNDLSALVRSFGKNNIKDATSVYFDYEYSGNYPKKATVKQKGTNTLSYTAEFKY
jgi:hypothetical protein